MTVHDVVHAIRLWLGRAIRSRPFVADLSYVAVAHSWNHVD